jgi:large subunit ribosomal protein L24
MAKKLKKGDQVIVICGSSKGKIGNILSVVGERVIVEGVNIATIHKKPTSSSPGEISKTEKSVHSSNVSHVENGKPIKIKFVIDNAEEKPLKRKSRVSKKSGKKIG